jgi:uncharacterized protein (DUF1501 family)
MAGGNDGLNTVVPYANDFYHKARPKHRPEGGQDFEAERRHRLHGAMTGFKELYDAGNLAVVQGVGYPNPNRSHFRSTEIWQTASDSDRVEKYGWLGRYFDNACAGADPTVGVTIGSQLPEAFFAKSRRAFASTIRRITASWPTAPATEESYKKLNELEMSSPLPDGGRAWHPMTIPAAASPCCRPGCR